MVKSRLSFLLQLKSHRTYLTVCLALFCTSIFSQNVVIEGFAAEYPEEQISFYRVIDQLSLKKEELGTCKSMANGKFEISFNVDKTQLIEIICKRAMGVILVEPEKTYHIELGKKEDKIARTFTNTPIAVSFQEGHKDALNTALNDFIKDYYGFLDESSYYLLLSLSSGNSYMESRSEKLIKTGLGRHESSDNIEKTGQWEEFQSSIVEFKNMVESKYSDFIKSSDFFNDYVNSSLAILDMSSGRDLDDIYNKHITSIDLSHPMNAELFKSFYGDVFFKQTKKPGPYVYDIINNSPPFDELDSLISVLDYMEDPRMRKLVFLFQARENYYSRKINQGILLYYINELTKDSDQEISGMSQNLVQQMTRGKKGSAVENFKMINSSNEFVQLEDLKGQFLYVGFYADWCRNCVEELKILEGLKDKYHGEISFISISMDEDFKVFKNHLINNKKQDWTFLFGGSDPQIIEKFGVKTLPAYFIIDPEGNIYQDYTKSPSEGIRNDLDQIMINLKSKQKKERIKVWDD